MALLCTDATANPCRLAADLGSFVGLTEPPGSSPGGAAPNQGPLPSSPFKLPLAYQESKERKFQGVAELRQHLMSVSTAMQSDACIMLLAESNRFLALYLKGSPHLLMQACHAGTSLFQANILPKALHEQKLFGSKPYYLSCFCVPCLSSCRPRWIIQGSGSCNLCCKRTSKNGSTPQDC